MDDGFVKLEDFRFILRRNGIETEALSFDDIFGYEGESCGVFLREEKCKPFNDAVADGLIPYEKDLPKLNANSGYGFCGICPGWEVKVMR